MGNLQGERGGQPLAGRGEETEGGESITSSPFLNLPSGLNIARGGKSGAAEKSAVGRVNFY